MEHSATLVSRSFSETEFQPEAVPLYFTTGILQLLKLFFPILTREDPSLTSVKHPGPAPAKALLLIVTILERSRTHGEIFLQLEKALLPIISQLERSIFPSRLVHFAKALSPTFVTPERSTSTREGQL